MIDVSYTDIGNDKIQVVSKSLDINVSLDVTITDSGSNIGAFRDFEHTLYDSDGIKICSLKFHDDNLNNPAQNSCVFDIFTTDNFIFNVACSTNIPPSLNIAESNYIVSGSAVKGFSIGNIKPAIDKSSYLVFVYDGTNLLTIKQFENGALATDVTIDTTLDGDAFFADIYYYVEAGTLHIETLKSFPFYFEKGADTTTLGCIIDFDGLVTIEDADATFTAFRSKFSSASEFSLVYDEIGSSPYYFIKEVVSSSGGGTTSSTCDISSELDEIKSTIKTTIQTYFENNPLNVDNVSITSIQSDVTTALGSFFNQGAYQDLSPITSVLESLSNSLSLLRTQVENINVSGGECDLTSIITKIDTLQSSVTSLDCNVDLTSVLDGIASVQDQISNITVQNVDCSTIDLSSLETSIIETISQNTHQFITNSSLNGANGAIYEDGEIVNVSGYVRTYEVVSSQVITTMDNQADYIYLLKDANNRYMITVQDMLSRPETVEGA